MSAKMPCVVAERRIAGYMTEAGSSLRSEMGNNRWYEASQPNGEDI